MSDPLPEPCRECGAEVDTHFVPETRERLIALNVCFNCNYWLERVDSKSGKQIVVGGVVYQRGAEKDAGPFRGFSGKPWRVKLHSGEEFRSTNMWFNGQIPDRFKSRIPDNAIFLSTTEGGKS